MGLGAVVGAAGTTRQKVEMNKKRWRRLAVARGRRAGRILHIRAVRWQHYQHGVCLH